MIPVALRVLLALYTAAYWAVFLRLWWVSRVEREPLAQRRARLWFLALTGAHALAQLLPGALLPVAAIPLILAPVLGAITWWLTRGAATHPVVTDAATERHDGRDIIFSRAKLMPGMPLYDAYYGLHPERKEKDDELRRLPGLLHLQSAFYHPYAFAAVRATFEMVYFGLYYYMDHFRFPRGVRPQPEAMSTFLQEWTRHLGAHSVGIAALKPEHFYTHGGYGDEHGVQIDSPHTFAISFTVEMDAAFTRMAPRPAEFMEVGVEYLKAANIATTLAGTIRQLGFSARAHVLDNHQVIQPLLARDSGLGELGRMSILMTPDIGPRVRIGTVTTDLPLVPDTRKLDPGVIDACLGCTKCADSCPAQAIPFGPPNQPAGAARWTIDHEACFGYWRKTGAPCGRCLAVCPFSLPDRSIHRGFKAVLRSGGRWRDLAMRWHDHFYGKRPRPLESPAWIDVPEADPDDTRVTLPEPPKEWPTVRVPGPWGRHHKVERPD